MDLSADSPENEWELSKENVQPLRQGRKMSSLNAGLKIQPGDQVSRIKEEKDAFEAELRTYTGEDPLEVWYRYILWAEQTFPKGGRDSNLTAILEHCVRKFKDVDQYRNDERYVYAWMKLADVCNDPLEIYSFMYDQNIGCEQSCFYEGWACLLEQLGNYKRADTVFQNGLRKNATPYENLKRRHEDFQMRVARKSLHGAEDAVDSVEECEGQHRQVLSQLRTMGKQKQAPVGRTGSAIRGSAGVLTGARPKTVQQVGSAGVQIFCDENQDPASLPPQTGQWATIPKRDVSNKENEKKAGIWTKQKMKKPSVNVPISAVNSYQQPSFTVHVDENSDQSMRTPAKMPEVGNQILSSRKEDKNTTSNYLRTFSASQDKNEQPMYCKDKIYCGADEYSFEELRAIRWVKRIEREEAEKAEKEIRAVLENQRQQLSDEAERVRQQRLQLQEEEKAMLEEARRKKHEIQQEMEKYRQAEIQRHQEMLEKDIQARLQEQNVRTQGLASTSKSHSARQLVLEDSFHGNLENIPSRVAQQLASGSTHPLQQKQLLVAGNQFSAENQSLNSSNRTPNSFASISQPLSAESFDRTMSGAPSPTVNTKEAMRLVMGMFNASLELDKAAPCQDISMNEPDEPNPPQAIGGSGGGLQFAIYDESQEQQNPPAKTSAPLFTVFQDDENSNAAMNVSTRNRRPRPAFGQQLEHVPQSTTQALFDEDNFDGIESHPRDDITLAPVGSHLSFAAAAKFASTPFNPNSSGGARNSPSLDVSDIEMKEDNRVEPALEPAVEPTVARSDGLEEMEHQENNDQTGSNTSSNSFRKNLSPIMEGSSEDSGANSKSSHLQHTTLESHHMASKFNLTPVMDQSEDTMSLLQAGEEGNQSTHVIDMSAYIPPEMDEKTEQLMSMSICIVDPKDPFDRRDREMVLARLKTPLLHYDTYTHLDVHMPDVKRGNILSLGIEMYEVMEKIAEGGFAKIFRVENNGLDLGTTSFEEPVESTFVIKVEEPAQKWEFYICNELHSRLTKLHDPVDMRPSVMQISNGYFYKNGSILVTDYHPYGTLLDLVNKGKSKNLQADTIIQHLEPVMAYMAIELLHLVENIHKCHIIHGDVKPDNFLVLQFPRLPVSTDPLVVFGSSSRFVQLIDFGQSIDMTKYPSGTTFLTKVNTECFECIEMKTNRPWTYQTDLFGLAGTIHVLVFNQYMKVYQEAGTWKMTSTFCRNWNVMLWKKLFHLLLNIPSCDDLPNLAAIRHEFEDYFVNDLLQKYNTQCGSFNKTIINT